MMVNVVGWHCHMFVENRPSYSVSQFQNQQLGDSSLVIVGESDQPLALMLDALKNRILTRFRNDRHCGCRFDLWLMWL